MNKPHHQRYLAHMTSPEIAALDKKEGVLILPIGAIEQHGPHLPTITDTLITTHMLDITLAQLPAEVRVWALPVLNYGKSNEHLAYPGTISFSAKTLMAVLHDIAVSVKRAGFRRLAFLNGHGGNMSLLNMVARDIHVETGLICFCINGFHDKPPFDISEEEWVYGLHGGEIETSMMLAMAPELVQMDKASRQYPNFPDTDTSLFLFGRASVAWLAHEWSENGIYGDATLGTGKKGEALIAEAVDNLTKLLAVISRFEVPNHGKA